MSRQFPHPFSDMAKRYREMRVKLPAQVSAIAIREFNEHFRKGGFYGAGGGIIPWKPRKRIEKGGRRALLVKSGRMKRGMRAMPFGDTACVRDYIPYAAIHNEGGTIKGTFTVRQHMHKGSVVKSHSRKVNITIPARPFMITTPMLEQEVSLHIDNSIEQVFNNSQNA